jgi:putative phage-type endonuclease
VTATEVAAVLGISPWDSAFNLYWRKRGEIPETGDDDRLSLGRHLEPWIADRWAAAHPQYRLQMGGLYASAARPWQLATPDRLLIPAGEASAGPVAVLEIKTSGSYDGWGVDGSDEIPPHYRAQVLWQADVLGLTGGDACGFVCCLFLSSRQIRTYRIAYDTADVAFMRGQAEEFLDRLRGGVPPDIDAHTATAAALRQLHPKVEDTTVEVDEDLAYTYRSAGEAVRDALTDKALVEAQLRAAMGNAKTAIDPAGAVVASRSVYSQTRIDRSRLCARWPQAFTDCQTTSTVDKITPARRKDPS